MAYAPAVVVEGPPRQPLPFGLFSVLTPRSVGDPHWQNGIEWEALSCDPASGIGDPDCDPETGTTGLPKDISAGNALGLASPFTIYGHYSCTPVGHTIEYAQQRAVEHLLAREEARVEQALWTGDLDNAAFGDGATDVSDGATSVTEAVAALEVWLATEYGSLGVIHAPRDAATIAVREGSMEVRGNALYTALGTPVVAGAGYPSGGSLYATPALLGYRSEPFPGASPASAGFDRRTNDILAVAERTYVIGWDPCGTAVATVTTGA